MLDLIKRRLTDERGIALIAVILVVAIFLVLTLALLFQGETEHIVVVNERDYLKTLGFAEGGLKWAERRIIDESDPLTFTDFTDLLLGPNDTDATDDYLLELRDLSLTNPSQFTNSNEATASAIVQRDFFGDGNKSYELIRMRDSATTRALVYVRIDDNFDDDPDDPSNNDPLTDTDRTIQATVVAEYPVFVDGSGAELPNIIEERGRAQRTLVVRFGPAVLAPAIVTNGDLELPGNATICGDCGSVHTNQDMDISGNPSICEDATATGSWTAGGSPAIGGTSGPANAIPVPIVNPYDDLLVPAINVFDTTALPLPAELRCGPPTPADPGNSKYFALVADDDKGKVFKAYWDFANSRWTWLLIDDLDDGLDIKLDDCGRFPTDPFYGAPVTDKPGDMAGLVDEFYGFKLSSTESTNSCTSCGFAGDDASLCTLSDNDFSFNCYVEAFTLTPQANVSGSGIPALPGSFAPDGQADFDAYAELGNSAWDFSSIFVFSPMFNAVVFVYGNASLSGNVGSSIGEYCSSGGCGGAGSVPNDVWNVSIISYGDIIVSGNPSYGPANAAAGFQFLLISGRDIQVSGNPGAGDACASGCSTTAPSNVDSYSGIIAAHEQVQFNGNPNILGFVRAEDAIDCSNLVSGTNAVNGNPSIFYDCDNPPSPWVGPDGKVKALSWQEVE